MDMPALSTLFINLVMCCLNSDLLHLDINILAVLQCFNFNALARGQASFKEKLHQRTVQLVGMLGNVVALKRYFSRSEMEEMGDQTKLESDLTIYPSARCSCSQSFCRALSFSYTKHDELLSRSCSYLIMMPLLKLFLVRQDVRARSFC